MELQTFAKKKFAIPLFYFTVGVYLSDNLEK